MKEVKIYTIVSDQLSPPITGESFCTDMVRHSDYAELEAKYAALVAENAELKSALNDIIQPDAAVLERNHRVRALDAMETPATDAFLAEVRASELDSLAGVAETMLIKFSNQQCSSDMHEVVGWKMILQQAANRAAQLRKGVAK
ncbi:hypothetical protein KDQ79_000109 [Salmonella enterica subsp. enterica serovar Hartford]|uniref:hypothetical protein n=1 Tax=Salmonella enterica TaxID=28901 RepID=UPI000E0C9959|nr:hypothetical protein [Salmonella enterica]EDQ9499528.1 hypothetical protein [Salmonella enterica subsp. enterica serovar Hartford]EAZ1839646.1 hypothetical protein [Salmonella enterica]EDR0327387.1 hypothetical protein [Salmonella enterica subsp. enterica serovar Hartford]EDW1443921.1 hypothetical protein [Salmonella enterica subsp. enterica serovar Hartford]EGJ3101637.1 hypothetical protein [Salmonella enterica subsp. enterica serovar Hartford]